MRKLFVTDLHFLIFEARFLLVRVDKRRNGEREGGPLEGREEARRGGGWVERVTLPYLPFSSLNKDKGEIRWR